ncbi:MAG: CHC2 zinc finger domain-containing protein [Nitrospirales bacterium]
MTIEDFLPRLSSVKQRGSRYSAICPGHADSSPSLSVSEGEKGLLLKCWAGCSIGEICASLGIEPKDLFFDSRIDPQAMRATRQRRAMKQKDLEVIGFTIDACKQAEGFIESRRGLDISAWSNERLDDELNALAGAYKIIEREERHE